MMWYSNSLVSGAEPQLLQQTDVERLAGAKYAEKNKPVQSSRRYTVFVPMSGERGIAKSANRGSASSAGLNSLWALEKRYSAGLDAAQYTEEIFNESVMVR